MEALLLILLQGCKDAEKVPSLSKLLQQVNQIKAVSKTETLHRHLAAKNESIFAAKAFSSTSITDEIEMKRINLKT